MLGLDYSAGRPRGSEVKRLGYGFVIRYCGQPGNPKNATRAEVDDMLAHGVAVALVFESTAARAAQGFDAGVADARAATAHQAALGIPASRPIYYAVDFDADPVAVEPYFRGVNSVPGPDSAYGSFRVVQRLRADGLTVDSWQTVAWSRGQVDPGRDVFQRLGQVTVDGVQCDVNETRTADFGQYPYQEDDMTPEQDQMLRIVYRQITGDEDDAGPDGWGWPSWAYGDTLQDGKTPRSVTPVDLLREIHRGVCSRLGLTNRPFPETQADTLFGHALSARAEVRALSSGGADPAAIVAAMAASSAFLDGLAARLAPALAAEQDRRARDNDPTTGPTT